MDTKLQLYRHVRNFLHNELGISKEYVQDLVRLTVHHWVDQYITHHVTLHKIEESIHKIIRESVQNRLRLLVEAETKKIVSRYCVKIDSALEKIVVGQ